jgi:pimeloyl-ACP methyl ester carboxylesterase
VSTRGLFGVTRIAALASLVSACAAGSGAQTTADDPGPAIASASSDASAAGSPDEAGGASLVSEDGAASLGDPPGSGDGGSSSVDAASPPSIGAPAIACNDIPSDVYVTPTGLAPMTMDARGAIVRCAFDSALSQTDVASELTTASDTGVTATSGVTLYRIAYRTYREDGVAGVSTARVYLPTTPRALPLPIIAVAHPTVGLATSCAPSEDPASLENLALPWAANGFAVVATDYAGLGNEGIQGYAGNHDQAHSLLDSVRALRALVDPRALGEQVVLVGHSQGGGAVLAAQGLAGTYGAGGTVVAAIVFAAEYFSRLDSFTYVTMMREPTALTISTGISKPVVAAMRDYAFGYNLLGASNANITFPAELQGMTAAITTLCQTPFGGYLQGEAVHVGDIFDPALTASFLACVDGTSGCAGTGSALYDWMTGDLIAPDPNGAPVLYVQGLADIIMPADEEAACNVQLLQNAGVPVQVCIDPSAQHTDVPQRNVGLALQWSLAKLAGTALPTCSSSGMPACSP